MKLGTVINAQAGGLLRDPELEVRLRDVVGSDALCTTKTLDEVPLALSSLRDAGCDTLLVVGGDGTVSGTLTPLLRVWPEGHRPAVALTRSGTVNTISKALGSRGRPERIAALLLEKETPRRVRRRPTVRIRPDAGEPVDGMLFVYGLGVRWLESYYRDSSQGLSGAALVIARAAASALARGELARRMFEPIRAELVLDGESLPKRDYTVLGAGGIRDIGLGFKPFPSAGSDPERIHLALSSASPLRFLRELPALQLGRSLPGSAIVHRPLREARVRPDQPQPWSVDGELFPPAAELWLGAGPSLDFVSVEAGFR